MTGKKFFVYFPERQSVENKLKEKYIGEKRDASNKTATMYISDNTQTQKKYLNKN